VRARSIQAPVTRAGDSSPAVYPSLQYVNPRWLAFPKTKLREDTAVRRRSLLRSVRAIAAVLACAAPAYPQVVDGVHTSTGVLDRALDTLLPAPEVRRLVFDLERLEYLSSAGIRCFIRARKQLEARHGRVALVNPQPPVRKVLEIVKAMPLNGIFSSTAELDAYLHDMQERARSGE
jgi:anti-anti-sigma factor